MQTKKLLENLLTTFYVIHVGISLSLELLRQIE
jgi:hypothetical protein